MGVILNKLKKETKQIWAHYFKKCAKKTVNMYVWLLYVWTTCYMWTLGWDKNKKESHENQKSNCCYNSTEPIIGN
jgi:hypothetical protein